MYTSLGHTSLGLGQPAQRFGLQRQQQPVAASLSAWDRTVSPSGSSQDQPLTNLNRPTGSSVLFSGNNKARRTVPAAVLLLLASVAAACSGGGDSTSEQKGTGPISQELPIQGANGPNIANPDVLVTKDNVGGLFFGPGMADRVVSTQRGSTPGSADMLFSYIIQSGWNSGEPAFRDPEFRRNFNQLLQVVAKRGAFGEVSFVALPETDGNLRGILGEINRDINPDGRGITIGVDAEFLTDRHHSGYVRDEHTYCSGEPTRCYTYYTYDIPGDMMNFALGDDTLGDIEWFMGVYMHTALMNAVDNANPQYQEVKKLKEKILSDIDDYGNNLRKRMDKAEERDGQAGVFAEREAILNEFPEPQQHFIKTLLARAALPTDLNMAIVGLSTATQDNYQDRLATLKAAIETNRAFLKDKNYTDIIEAFLTDWFNRPAEPRVSVVVGNANSLNDSVWNAESLGLIQQNFEYDEAIDQLKADENLAVVISAIPVNEREAARYLLIRQDYEALQAKIDAAQSDAERQHYQEQLNHPTQQQLQAFVDYLANYGADFNIGMDTVKDVIGKIRNVIKKGEFEDGDFVRLFEDEGAMAALLEETYGHMSGVSVVTLPKSIAEKVKNSVEMVAIGNAIADGPLSVKKDIVNDIKALLANTIQNQAFHIYAGDFDTALTHLSAQIYSSMMEPLPDYLNDKIQSEKDHRALMAFLKTAGMVIAVLAALAILGALISKGVQFVQNRREDEQFPQPGRSPVYPSHHTFRRYR